MLWVFRLRCFQITVWVFTLLGSPNCYCISLMSKSFLSTAVFSQNVYCQQNTPQAKCLVGEADDCLEGTEAGIYCINNGSRSSSSSGSNHSVIYMLIVLVILMHPHAGYITFNTMDASKSLGLSTGRSQSNYRA